MPFKDRDAKNAYQRRYYQEHPEQRQKQLQRTAKRKWEVYGGICLSCGGPTMGETKGAAAEFCGKPECRSMQLRELYGQVKLERKEQS